MPRIKELTLYAFDELEDDAKEKAREWYRINALDYDWWDGVYEDAKQCASQIGIWIDNIYFSGFSSQGDGACFTGGYSYLKGSLIGLTRHAPQDMELHRIARELQAVQRRTFYKLSASMEHRGHYYHSGCMSVHVEEGGRYDCNEDDEEAITQLMRDFADWIYRQLEREYEWLMSDEQVDESIRVNEYEFDEEGHRV